MKKNYLKPSTELLDLVVSNYIAAASSSEVGGEESDEFDANVGRGEWGNVWGGGRN